MDEILWMPMYYIEYMKVNPADKKVIADESNLDAKVKEVKAQFGIEEQ